jgi:hypothetical protein
MFSAGLNIDGTLTIAVDDVEGAGTIDIADQLVLEDDSTLNLVGTVSTGITFVFASYNTAATQGPNGLSGQFNAIELNGSALGVSQYSIDYDYLGGEQIAITLLEGEEPPEPASAPSALLLFSFAGMGLIWSRRRLSGRREVAS